MQPDVTVIIPVYKVEDYLRRCLDSVCEQTLKNIEIILIDDGSPDHCGEICDEYAAADQRIKVLHKENGGVSSARNAGLEIASGKYISFVDSDDFIRNNMIEQLYGAACMYNADLAFCLYEEIDGNTSRLSEFPKSVDITKTDANGALYEFYDYKKLIEVTIWNKLYKKELISDIRFDINKKSAEDVEFLMKYILRCSITVKVNASLYGYYVQRMNAAQSKKNNDIQFYVVQHENVQKIADMTAESKPEMENDIRAFFIANGTIPLANAIVRNDLYRSSEIKIVKSCYKKNLKHIINSKLLFSKKIQVLVFLLNVRLYGLLMKLKK